MNRNKIITKLNLANEKLSKLDLEKDKEQNLTKLDVKVRRIQKNLNLANEKLSKLNNYEIGYTEDKTIWYPILKIDQFPIVKSKIKIVDLPNIPLSKIENLYPIQYIDGGNLDATQ